MTPKASPEVFVAIHKAKVVYEELEKVKARVMVLEAQGPKLMKDQP